MSKKSNSNKIATGLIILILLAVLLLTIHYNTTNQANNKLNVTTSSPSYQTTIPTTTTSIKVTSSIITISTTTIAYRFPSWNSAASQGGGYIPLNLPTGYKTYVCGAVSNNLTTVNWIKDYGDIGHWNTTCNASAAYPSSLAVAGAAVNSSNYEIVTGTNSTYIAEGGTVVVLITTFKGIATYSGEVVGGDSGTFNNDNIVCNVKIAGTTTQNVGTTQMGTSAEQYGVIGVEVCFALKPYQFNSDIGFGGKSVIYIFPPN